MQKRHTCWLLAALLGLGLVTTGCGKSDDAAASGGKVDAQSLKGTGDYSNMPPEARKAMEEAKAKSTTGQPK